MNDIPLPKITLAEMELYCNNYFNSRNDPTDPERNYPDGFLWLAHKIEAFIFERQADVCNEKQATWQEAFARELGMYKRVKFL